MQTLSNQSTDQSKSSRDIEEFKSVNKTVIDKLKFKDKI